MVQVPTDRTGQTRRRSLAQAVSWWRLDSCSLRSTADTWVSTVFTDSTSRDGDLLVRVAPGDQAQHLALAGGEPVELGIDRRRLVAGEGVEHEPGEARREHGVAAVHPHDRLAEIGGGDRLGRRSRGHRPGRRRSRRRRRRTPTGRGSGCRACRCAAPRSPPARHRPGGARRGARRRGGWRRMTVTASSADAASPTTSMVGAPTGRVSSDRTPARMSAWSSTRTMRIMRPLPRDADLDLGAGAGLAHHRRLAARPLGPPDDRVGEPVRSAATCAGSKPMPVSRT